MLATHDWPVRTHEEIGPGDTGTLGRTLPWMQVLVREGRGDPLVAARAQQIIAASPHLHPVEALFRHVQALPYRYDEQILAKAGVSGDTSELLQGAPYQIARELQHGPAAAEGDCDDRAILLQSMLESQGYATRFVLIRGPGRPDYSHVYSEVEVGGRWLPIDSIFNGVDGRAFYAPGDEVGAAEGARDRVSVGVDGLGPVSPLPLVILAALYFWSRR